MNKGKMFGLLDNVNNRILKIYERKYAYVIGIGIECALCILWMFYSRINIQLPVKILGLVLSFFAMRDFEITLRYIQGQKRCRTFWIGLPIVSFITAFTLVGNRGIIYPLDTSITFGRIVTLILVGIWSIPIILLFIRTYEKVGLYENKKEHYRSFIIICSVVIIVPACFALAAFNPGISSYDTNECLAIYAHNIKNMPNWHPPFYVLLLKLIITVWDSTYAVIIVQFVFWEFVVLELIAFLYRKNISDKMLLVFAVFWGVNTSNVLYLCTIWKDIPYGISLLWLTLIISKLVVDRKYYEGRRKIYIELVIALVLVCFMRQNGIVPYILSVLGLVIFYKKNRKLILSIATSLVLIFVIRGPLYSAIGVVETPETFGGKYIGLGQDILAAYYTGGDLSEEALEIVNVLTNNNRDSFGFNPYWANSSYALDVSMTEFVKIYFDTFIENPTVMIKEILCRNDCIWDVFEGEGARVNLINYLGHWDGNDNWNDYYPPNKYTAWSNFVSKDTTFTGESQLFSILFWRCGVYFLIGIYVFWSMQIKRVQKECYLVFVPYVAQILSLVLSTGWSDFRYYWPLNLMIVAILFLGIVAKNDYGELRKACTF